MKKVFIFILTSVVFISCKQDFIDLVPEDNYTDASFYKTEQHFRQAVVAAYAPLRDVLVNDYLTSEMHSDNTIYQSFRSNRGPQLIERENLSDFLNTSTNAYGNAVWQHCYTGISRCNVLIERLPAATAVSDSLKTLFDGQAKFLRAWYYFKLVRLYGGVPLFLKEVRKADDAFLPRSTSDQVYQQIVADATEAVSKLKPPAKFPQTGEATKGSATTLLAEVYVTQKKWAEAEILLSTLPAMGYALMSNYADAFDPKQKNGRESVFEVQFLEGNTTGTTPNPLVFHFLPRSTSTALITGIAINNNLTGGWNTPSDDLIKSYEPNDKRLDASIAVAEGTYNASDLFAYSANKSIINYMPAAGKTGVPYIKKFVHTPVATVNGSNDNFPLYRYADVLLLLAEALNEQGKSPLTSLNEVRARAGLPAITLTGQAVLRDAIFRERRVELAFENDRWPDLVRSGNAIKTINDFGMKVKQQLNYIPADAYNIDQHHLLLPIPQPDIELNPDIKQNPGYF